MLHRTLRNGANSIKIRVVLKEELVALWHSGSMSDSKKGVNSPCQDLTLNCEIMLTLTLNYDSYFCVMYNI